MTVKDILNEYISNNGNKPYNGNGPYKELFQVKSPLCENIKTKKKAAISNSGDESKSKDNKSENKGNKNNNKVEFTPTLNIKKHKLLPFTRLDNNNTIMGIGDSLRNNDIPSRRLSYQVFKSEPQLVT